jgi:hypothetical protein
MTATPAKDFWCILHKRAPTLPDAMRLDLCWDHRNPVSVELPLQWFCGTLVLSVFFGRN